MKKWLYRNSWSRSWDRNWIALTATVVHLLWGIILLFDDAPLRTTPLGVVHKFPLLSHHLVAAIVYISASLLAAIPLIWPRHDTQFTGLVCSSPQQFLLMVSFFTAVIAIVQGQYPDGYVPDQYGNPHLFIFCDQLWPMVGFVGHTMSLLDWYWWSRGEAVESE